MYIIDITSHCNEIFYLVRNIGTGRDTFIIGIDYNTVLIQITD